jgi:transposase
MRLYYSPGSCALGIHVLLEELGAPFELKRLNFAEREQYGEAYLAINPKSKVPTLERDDGSVQAASPVGLAPVPRDSGQTHGKRSIRGGRSRARQALYMPALNAIRLNPEFKAKYQAMVKAGKPAKVAIVAIMRKLIILANALIRDQRKWAPANP